MNKEDKIRVTYSNGKVMIKTSGDCLYWGYDSICEYPLRRKNAKGLRCKYGLTDIFVPDNCPLRGGPLETKVELIKNDS